MLLIGSRLIGAQVMSLQTGSALAQTVEAIIDPAVLAVVAYRLEGAMLERGTYYVRIDDVRELSDIGMIIDSADELVASGDVIKLDDIIELGFKLVGMLVMDETGKKLGKVIDYNLDTTSFKVEQLTVRRPFFSSLKDVELLVHRSQIIEINDRGIVIHSRAKAPEHTRVSTPGAYVNPFRKQSSAPQNGHAADY
mgnify:CR=1 FL=1